jgi:hypothetical protein
LKVSEVVLALAMTKHYMPIWEYVKAASFCLREIWRRLSMFSAQDENGEMRL